MIFVTVGMHPTGFERLVREMDEVAGKIDEEVIMQIGGTKYIPLNAKHFGFGTEDEVKLLCQEARIVVTHGGVGTILNVLQGGATVVVVPRLGKYGEAIDDHQLVFVQELEKKGRITAVYDVESLEDALRKVDSKPAPLAKDRSLVNALKTYIGKFERK